MIAKNQTLSILIERVFFRKYAGMGYLRFNLAFIVLLAHTIAWNGSAGRLAVFGFYLLCGFGITRVINEVYTRPVDKLWFAINRFFRVYPTYIVCFFISLILLYLSDNELQKSYYSYRLPNNAQAWFDNITIFGLGIWDHKSEHFVLSTAWSLSIELFHYIIIALITGRSKVLTWCGLLIGSLITLHLATTIKNPMLFYFHPYAHTPLFMMGGLLYHHRFCLQRFCNKNLLVNIIILNMSLYTTALFGITTFTTQEFLVVSYLCSLGTAYVILSTSFLRLRAKQSTIDEFLSDLSYPLFLTHIPIIAFMSYVLDVSPSLRTVKTFLIGAPLSILVAVLITFYVEIPIKKVRKVIRALASSIQSTPK